MKQIGAEIGVNESRVSQLHARAIRRLRDALGELGAQQMADVRRALVAFASKRKMVKAQLPPSRRDKVAVVLPYQARPRRQVPARATLKIDHGRRVVAR
jgi:hypothetical protein